MNNKFIEIAKDPLTDLPASDAFIKTLLPEEREALRSTLNEELKTGVDYFFEKIILKVLEAL